MTLAQQNKDAALALLSETFPQTFVLEKYRPHRPLKIGIAADIASRFPAIEPHELSAVLRAYTNRVMYLKSMVVGTLRVDLDGNPASEVTPSDAEHAAASLVGILAARQAKQTAAREAARAVVWAAAMEARRVAIAKGLKQRPLLHLPTGSCK